MRSITCAKTGFVPATDEGRSVGVGRRADMVTERRGNKTCRWEMGVRGDRRDVRKEGAKRPEVGDREAGRWKAGSNRCGRLRTTRDMREVAHDAGHQRGKCSVVEVGKSWEGWRRGMVDLKKISVGARERVRLQLQDRLAVGRKSPSTGIGQTLVEVSSVRPKRSVINLKTMCGLPSKARSVLFRRAQSQ